MQWSLYEVKYLMLDQDTLDSVTLGKVLMEWCGKFYLHYGLEGGYMSHLSPLPPTMAYHAYTAGRWCKLEAAKRLKLMSC